MQKDYDILTFGDLCVDLIIHGDDVTPQFGQVEKLVGDYTLEMGGSCSIFACQAAKLGLRTAILGKVGADQFGELILARLQQSGVDTTHVHVDHNLKTGLGIALCTSDGDRAILTYMGTINALQPADLPSSLLASTRHLHHGSYFLHTGLRPHISEIFHRARQHGATTSLDTNWDPDETWGPELQALIPLVDIFLPNEQEALRITAQPNLHAAASWATRKGSRLVAIKRGAKGAAAWDGSHWFEREVLPVSGGDSIGAGDSFDAGFLAGWLRNFPIEQCLDIAITCGRSVAAQVGGLAGQPRWQELL